MINSDILLVDEIASKLESAGFSVSVGSVALAKYVLANAHGKHVTCGRRPATLAASALYIACRTEGKPISQMNVASAAGITEPTVREFYSFLMSRLNLAFPSDEPRKRLVRLGNLKVKLEKVLQMIDDCSARLKKLEAERDSSWAEIKRLVDQAKEESSEL